MEIRSPYCGDYLSPPRDLGGVVRRWPSLVFHPGMARIIWRAARLAKAGRYDDAAWVQSSIDVTQLVEAMGASIRIENVDAYRRLSTPAVVIGNHMSTLETFVLPGVLRPIRPVTFVVKRELVTTPVFKHIMISRNPVVVGRDNPRDDLRAVLSDGEARLRAGVSVIVFPQRTRAAHFNSAEFNSVGVKLAKRAGVPVVPLALRSDAWGIGSLVKEVGPFRRALPVRFSFGEPIEVTGNGRAAHGAVVAFIEQQLREWGVPVMDGSGAPASGGSPAPSV